MGLQDLANAAEVVSGVVVAITLIYLVIQIRQNTASIRAENFARALDRVSAMQSALFENAELARLQAQGALDPSKLTREERLRLTWWFLEAFGTFEFMFHEARSGALPDEVWHRWSVTIAWWVSFPGVQAWWRAIPTPFSQSFTSFVDDTIRNGRSDSAAANRFDAFLRGTSVREAQKSPAV